MEETQADMGVSMELEIVLRWKEGRKEAESSGTRTLGG
jgi:hypothetical protein